MTEQQFVVLGIICFVIVVILATSFYSTYRLQRKVKAEWGTSPTGTRLDQEESLNFSYRTIKKHLQSDSEIDDITWNDLDFFSIFKQLNHTYSSIGSEALYRRLRLYNFSKKEQENMESLIDFLDNHPNAREKIEFAFAQLGKKDKNYVVEYLLNSERQKLNNLSLYVLLGLSPLVLLSLFFIVGWDLAIFLFLGSIIFNIVYYQSKKIRLESELTSMSYLIQTIATAKKLTKMEHPLRDRINTAIKPLKSTLRFSFSFRIKSNSDAEMLFDYINMMVMLPFIAYHFVLKRLSTYQEESLAMWELLGQLEVACAILNYRTYSELYCLPTFKEGGVTAENIAHPLVKEPVLNPVDWQKNTLVTGSNASGKSTYVKAVAINCILAQTIYTCTADSFSLEPGHVLTSMAVQDDVQSGDSYFVAEIKSLKRVLDKIQTNEHCYLFIDEILKGTNTIERIAASANIVHWMNDYPSLAFVATHDIELTKILSVHCDNVHFQEQVTKENGVYFDYLLREGPATSRNALRLLQVMNYPKVIIEHAKTSARNFEQTEQWDPIN